MEAIPQRVLEHERSSGLQASVNNFAFQTPNPYYYQELAKLKLVKTGETSGGINTPVGGTNFMSTMVGTTVTGGNNL
jgi:hypothetical protein